MQAFNTSLASLVTGASQRQLRHWDKTSLLRPSVSRARGRGSRRLYSFVDLVAAAAVNRLRKDGLSLQKIRKAVRLLKEHPDDITHPLAELKLVTDGEAVFRLTDDPVVREDILRGRQLVHIIGIKAICDEVHAKLKREVREVRKRMHMGGKRYTVVVEPDLVDGGFVAECRALPGCVTDGETVEEALCNARDAITDWLAAGEEPKRAKAQ